MTDEKRDSDDPESAGASEAASERTGGTEPTVVGGGRSRDPRVILDEMLDAIALIQRYTHGLSYAEFAAQQVLQDAVIPRIAILGAAATHLPEQDRARWTDVPWRIIMDTRNRLIHGYFAVRLDLVWQVVAVDLRPLQTQLLAIRNTLP